MKRALSLFLALVLCLSLLPTAAFADSVSITATANNTAPAIGDTIEVTFALASNPGFTNIEMTLEFDSDVLQFTGLKTVVNDDGDEEISGKFKSGLTVVNTTVASEKYGFVTNARESANATTGNLFVALFDVIGSGSTTVSADVSVFQNAGDDGTATSHTPTVTPSAEIAVAGIPATSVTLDKTELSLEEGENYLLTATVEPTDTTDEIVWSSSDESVATVVNGQVKAVAAGTATITAKANDSVSASCAVTVTAEQSIVHKSPDGYSGITATAEMTGVKSLVVGGSTKTIKNIYKLPLNGHEEAYVHMDGAGTGQGAAYKLDGTAVFGVPNGADLTKFTINIAWASAYTADLLVTEAELTAAVGEENISKLGLSDDKLYAFLYIEDPWKNRNSGILFEITPVAATGVEVQETMELYEGESGELSVSVLPADNTDGLTVTYSSDSEAVATVDADGKVTAVAPGTAVITVTAGDHTDTCTVTVKSGYVEIENVPGNGDTWSGSVTGITIKNVTVDSYQWNGKTLNVFIAEDTATATVIFNFNQNGYDNKFEETAAITNGSGTLTKTFTHSDGWDSYESTWVINFIKTVPATSIELDKTTLELTKGSDATLIATLSEGATDTVTWSSSDESVATVDASGKVTGVAAGEATITATAGNYSAECKVTVYAVPATSVTISGDRIENGKLRLLKGERYKPAVTITPEDATDKVDYASSDQKIAVVYPTGAGAMAGQIWAKAVGTATYTVTAGNVSASIEVEVYEAYGITIGEMENGTVTADPASAAEGETVTLTVTPAEGYMLDTLTVMNGETPVVVKDNTFTMPAAAVTVSATFKEVPVVEGYTYATSADVTAENGGTAVVSVMVTGNSYEDVTTYNAYDLTLTFDSDKLELATDEAGNYIYSGAVSSDNGSVTVEGNTIHIVGCGANKDFTTAIAALTFKTKAEGAADVTVTKTQISVKEDAVAADTPEATAVNADGDTAADATPAQSLIVVPYSVDKPDFVSGAEKVLHGEDYTFSYADTTNYTYSDLSVTVGGTAVENLTADENGVYTIENVTGAVVIDAKQTANSYEVSKPENVNGPEEATYGEDYKFTVTPSEGMETESVTVTTEDGTTIDTTINKNGEYVIEGEDISGPITITVNEKVKGETETTITFTGVEESEVEGGLKQTATIGQPFSFKLNKVDGYAYTVMVGDTELTETDGQYTIPAELVVESGVTVTITKEDTSKATVDVHEYISLDGKTMFLVNAKWGDKVLAYGEGNTMFWSSKYTVTGEDEAGAYSWLVVSTDEMNTADLVKAAAEAAIVEAAEGATATPIAYDYDVNQTTKVDVNDAQLVYDMYNASYMEFTENLPILKFLEADVAENVDMKLDVNDVVAVINYIVNGTAN